jgi:hypothetical protein
VYANVRMTCVTRSSRYYDKQDIARTKTGAGMMKEIGKCIKQGGRVTFDQWFVGHEEYASATLEWEQDDDNDGAGQQRQHRGDD